MLIRSKNIFVLLGVSISLILYTGCKDNSLPTILVLGQSNITGWGDVDLIPEEDKDKFNVSKESIFYMGYGRGKFSEYEHVHRARGDKYLNSFGIESRSTFSPVFSLYPLMSELYNNHQALIFHYAIASLSSYSSWHPEWNEERMMAFPNHANNDTKHDQYKKCMNHLTLARRVAKEQGFTGLDIKAVIWFGGEIDALNRTASDAYYDSMRDIINAIRNDVGIPDLPFILQQVNCITLPYNDLVRAHQVRLANEIPNVHLIPTNNDRSPSDYSKYNDQLHYDTQGVLNLGKEAGYKTIDCILGR